MVFHSNYKTDNENNTKNRKIMPPTYFVSLLVLSIVLNLIFPFKKLVTPPYSYFGIAFIILGIVMNIWSDSLFKKIKTTIKPHEMPTSLVMSGPFKINRNPIYLGLVLILIGTALILGSLITFFTPIIFIIIINMLFIPMEEKNLENIFDREYADYKKRVRRWI